MKIMARAPDLQFAQQALGQTWPSLPHTTAPFEPHGATLAHAAVGAGCRCGFVVDVAYTPLNLTRPDLLPILTHSADVAGDGGFMNRAVGVLGILLFLSGCGSEGSSPSADVPGSDVPMVVDPDATPVGEPSGSAVTMSIGPTGGTLASVDGRLELVLPAGALARDTTVSLQAISNEAPGGLGEAWRLDAEGAAFAKPVTLVFHPGSGDLDGTALEAVDLGYQGIGGAWFHLADPTRDTATGTVTATTTHFTDFAPMSGYLLLPRQAKVRVGQQQAFTLNYCQPIPDPTCDDATVCLAPLVRVGPCAPMLTLQEVAWAVQNVPGGNATVGTITGNHLSGTYTAPQTPPVGNATVTATFNHAGGQLILLSPVEVYVPYTGTITVVGPDWTFDAEVTTVPDSGSLKLELTRGTTTFTDPKLVPKNEDPGNQFEGAIIVSQDPPSMFMTVTFQRFWACPTCETDIPALDFLLVWHQTYDAQCESYFVPVSDWSTLQGSIDSNCTAPFATDPLHLVLSWDLKKANP